MENQELYNLVSKVVMDYIETLYNIPVGVSNRHVHLCQRDFEVLFGKGAVLHEKKKLVQPGQFAAEETVILKGPKGEINSVRILGPLRKDSQIEISQTDSFQLGVKAPVRESGVLEETPGIILIGPKGTVELYSGVIIAQRHIHLSPEVAQILKVNDKETVCVETGGIRSCVLKNVVIRISDKFVSEMHIDTDESNACGLKNGDRIQII